MTTDKARAEACLNELQDLLGRIHNPGPEEAAQQIIEKHLTARDAEAALAKWQHEAEGLREAVRVLRNGVGPLVSACEECVKDSCGYDDDEWAIEAPITWGMIRNAKAAIDAAGGVQ